MKNSEEQFKSRAQELANYSEEEEKAHLAWLLGEAQELYAANKKKWKWAREFMGSINDQAQKRSLSEKQLYWVAKIEAQIKNAPQEQKEENSFSEDYLANESLRKDLEVVVDYYRTTGYWQDFIQSYDENKENPSWVPEKHIYDRIVKNQYAQRLLNVIATEPKFQEGDWVQLRTAALRVCSKRLLGKTLMVVGYPKKVGYPNPTKGSKLVEFMPIGEQKTFTIEERFLKSARV